MAEKAIADAITRVAPHTLEPRMIEAAARLDRIFRGLAWFRVVGVDTSTQTIIVYTRIETTERDRTITNASGFAVRYQTIGEVVAG